MRPRPGIPCNQTTSETVYEHFVDTRRLRPPQVNPFLVGDPSISTEIEEITWVEARSLFLPSDRHQIRVFPQEVLVSSPEIEMKIRRTGGSYYLIVKDQQFILDLGETEILPESEFIRKNNIRLGGSENWIIRLTENKKIEIVNRSSKDINVQLELFAEFVAV